MKKTGKIILSIIALLIVVAIAVSALFFGGKKPKLLNGYDEIYTKGTVQIPVNDGMFTIFKINDTHFINGTCDDDKNTLSELKSALDKSKFDMIIVDGDLVEGYNSKITYNKYKAAELFAELIETYAVPWAFVPGNNDGQKGGSNEELVTYFMQYEHFLCGNEKGLSGAVQFFTDLTENGKTVHSLAFLDSHSLDAAGKYDYIKQDQIDWLNKETNNKKVKTSVFFHMPTPAFKTAYESGEEYKGFPFCDEYAVDDIKKNAAFDEQTADNKYITLLSTAHVHSDNMAYFYNGRYYQLSSLGGYGAVGSQNTAPSFTIIKIDVNASNTKDMYAFSKVQGK